MIMGNWDVAMIIWGVVWILGGAALIYGLVRAIAAEDREIREAQQAEMNEESRKRAEVHKVSAA